MGYRSLEMLGALGVFAKSAVLTKSVVFAKSAVLTKSVAFARPAVLAKRALLEWLGALAALANSGTSSNYYLSGHALKSVSFRTEERR